MHGQARCRAANQVLPGGDEHRRSEPAPPVAPALGHRVPGSVHLDLLLRSCRVPAGWPTPASRSIRGASVGSCGYHPDSTRRALPGGSAAGFEARGRCALHASRHPGAGVLAPSRAPPGLPLLAQAAVRSLRAGAACRREEKRRRRRPQLPFSRKAEAPMRPQRLLRAGSRRAQCHRVLRAGAQEREDQGA